MRQCRKPNTGYQAASDRPHPFPNPPNSPRCAHANILTRRRTLALCPVTNNQTHAHFRLSKTAPMPDNAPVRAGRASAGPRMQTDH